MKQGKEQMKQPLDEQPTCDASVASHHQFSLCNWLRMRLHALRALLECDGLTPGVYCIPTGEPIDPEELWIVVPTKPNALSAVVSSDTAIC